MAKIKNPIKYLPESTKTLFLGITVFILGVGPCCCVFFDGKGALSELLGSTDDTSLEDPTIITAQEDLLSVPTNLMPTDQNYYLN